MATQMESRKRLKVGTADMEKHASGMSYAKLGATGPVVSEICLGTMVFGSQVTDEAKVQAICDRYVEAGGNYIDTAEMYPVPPTPEYIGATEDFLGRWLEARPGLREKIVIATKVAGPAPRAFVVANRTDPKTEGEVKMPNLDKDSIFDACQASMRRLKTDYLDILYLHWPSRPTGLFGTSIYTAAMKDKHPFFGDKPYTAIEIEESVQAMGDLIKKGTIRAWAISNENAFGVCQIMNACAKLGVDPPCCIQNDFSLTDRRFEAEVAEACAPWHYNISGCPYGLLAGGTLSGKYLNGEKPKGARHEKFPNFQIRYLCTGTCEAVAKYNEVAKKANISLTQLSLAWAKSRFFNQSLIIGVSTLEQVEECLGVVNIELDEETLAAIDKIHFENKNPNVMK